MSDTTQGSAAHSTTDQRSGDEHGARAAVHDAGDRARELKETGREEVGRVAHEVASQTSHVVDETRQRAKARVDSQVDHVASMLGDMSGDLDRMANETESPLGSLARDGAAAMRSVSHRLEDDGLEGVMTEARQFARRRPMVFIAGAFAVGVMAGRLVRNTDMAAVASGSDDHRPSGQNGSAQRNAATVGRSQPTDSGGRSNVGGAFVGTSGGRT